MSDHDEMEQFLRHCASHPYARKYAARLLSYAEGGKVEATMKEFKEGDLHSGSKEGPKVTDRKQAIAIGLSQARKAGEKV